MPAVRAHDATAGVEGGASRGKRRAGCLSTAWNGQRHQVCTLSSIESASSAMASGISKAQEKAANSVSSAAEGARERLSEGASAVKHQGERLADRAAALHNSNPLAIGAVALAAGALLGGLIPNTRFENETMGRSADCATSKAGEALGEAVDAAGADIEKAGERMSRQT